MIAGATRLTTTRVPVLWPGEPVVVCGAGPSLCADDLDLVRAASPRPRVVVVNDAYRLAPWADALYAADYSWWKWHAAVADGDLPPLLFTAQPQSLMFRPSARLLSIVAGNGIATTQGQLHSGGHGGHQAINLAVQLAGGQPSSIILLGFDMGADPADPTRHHFHDEHPNKAHPTYHARLPAFRTLAAALAAHTPPIPIVNCSRRTAIPQTVIPRGRLDEVLREYDGRGRHQSVSG